MSVSAPTGPSDLDVIAQGGENFSARMTAFYSAKEQMEKALADLNLGKSAADAYAEAQDAKSKAKDALATAKAKAEALVNNAKEEADRLVREAAAGMEDRRNALTAAEADLKQRMAAFDQMVKDATAEAKAATAEAKKTAADNLVANKALLKKQMDLDLEKVAATEARQKWEKAHADLMAAIQTVRPKDV